MDNATDPLLGRVLEGRYRIDSRIARGGMAMVYLGHDLRLDRTIAIKVMHAGFGDDAAFVARFIREARSAAALAHPNVVSVFDQGDDNGTLFLVMEFVPGVTMRDLIRAKAPMAPARALALMDPVLSALQSAHNAGMVHRDIKPENVLLGTSDLSNVLPARMKVADFGLARAVSAETQHTTTSGVLIGTVSYLAPELLVDNKGDARADVYAAGVLIYELLTGSKPHQGESPIQVAYKHVHEDIPPPSYAVGAIPPYVDALVARATARDTDVRPSDAGVLLQHVRRVRHALEQHVADDPELTQDLTPLRSSMAGTRDLPRVSRLDEATGPLDFANEPEMTSRLPMVPTPPDEAAAVVAKKAKRKKRHPMRWLIALLLLIGAAVAAFFLFVTSVPSVLNLTQIDAAAKLQKVGLHLKVTGSGYSETVAKGLVLKSSPRAGGEILKGGTVDVELSLGPERHEVPDLKNMTLDQARNTLQSAHLVLGNHTEDFSDTAPPGTIVATTPAAGTPMRPNSAVDVVVSKGPQPVPIPDVTNQPLGTATKTLTDLQFKVDSSAQQFSDTVPTGSVISESPAPGGTGHHGDTISLVVSKGPQTVAVPQVKGMSWNDAVAALKAAGLSAAPGNVNAQVASTIFPTVAGIKKTDPAAGTQVKIGSTVNIYF